MADYFQIKNQSILNPPANTNLGNATNQYSNVYAQSNLIVGNTTFTSATLGAPKITTITYPGDDTAADPAGGQTITLTGSGFNAGASVVINGNAVGVVSVVSSTSITFTSPALSAGSYIIYVVNTDGSTAIAIPGIQYSGTPTWTTASGSVANIYETQSINNTFVATGDAPITYSLFSGTLPPTSTLNSSTGVLSGTANVTASPTTYTFTIRATDAESQDTNRQFSITLNPDTVTWSSPADNSTVTLDQNTAMSNVTLSATSAAGYGITYTANSLPTGLSISGANVTGTPTVIANTTTLLTATASTTSRTATRTINWVVQLGSDPYFNLTTLLLNGETSSNYWIQDASTNKFAATVNGDTKQFSFSPYNTQYGVQLDGSDDYVGFPNGTAVQFSTGSFTIECFVFRDNTGGAYPVIFTNTPGDGGSSGEFTQYMIHPAGNNLMYAGGTYISGGTLPPTFQWCHVALCRDGTSTRLYVNGSVQWEANSGSIFTATYGLASGTFTIGTRTAGGSTTCTKGYVSNFRVTKGICLYTGSTITVPTSKLTVGANTTVLTLQDNRLIDNSTSALTITSYNGAVISGLSPFLETDTTTGSGYFDGTGDSLSFPSNLRTAMGGGFAGNLSTMEAWIYTSTEGTIFGRYDAIGENGRFYWARTSDNNLIFLWTTSPSSATSVFSTGSLVRSNQWTHVAMTIDATTASSSTIKMFINGTLANTFTSQDLSSQTAFAPSNPPAIGTSTAASSAFSGYISNFRFVTGYLIYTSTFTPPTSPLTAVSGTSLLTLQNRLGENNNRFIDTSTNSLTVTRYGNTNQGTFSPFSQTGWSSSFNGSNDPVSLASTTALNIESVDFTIEAWIFMNVMPTGTSTTSWAGDWSSWFIIYERSAGGTTGWQFRVGATLLTLGGDGDSSIAWGTHGMTTNTWYHVAVSRASSTYRMFVNGTSLSLTTQATSMATSGTYYIGSEDSSGANFNGYISNLRVIKSQAIYTGAFTPSTTPLSNYSVGSTGAGAAASITGSISLLTCNSANWIDNSPNLNAISRSGVNTRVQAFSPFAPAIVTPTSYSGYFDGTGDYLSLTSALALRPENSDFTLECWIYIATPSDSPIYESRTGSGSTDGFTLTAFSSTVIRIFTTSAILSATVANYSSIWTHVAVVRASGTTTLYVNGVSGGTTTSLGNLNGTDTVLIGGGRYGGSPASFNGHISNFRIVKGTAVYTSGFTPPTSPLTAIANTSLLTCQSNRFIDNSTNNFTITANGDAKAAQFNPFGVTTLTGANAEYSLTNVGGSMYFDGSGNDYLATAGSKTLTCTGDFTIEYWHYDDGSSVNYPNHISSTDWNTGTGGVGLRYNNTGQASKYGFFWYGVGDPYFTSTNSFAARNWNHVALTRSGTSIRMFINGSLQASGTNSGTIDFNLTSGGARIGGGNWDGANSYMKGYLSNMRLVKGTALYTSPFVPPVAPLTAISGSVLLMSANNSGFVDYTGKNDFETVANAQLSTTVSKFGNASMYFDGTGDYLTIRTSPLLDFGTGDFTVEFWWYSTSVATDQGFLGGGAGCYDFVWRTSTGFNLGRINTAFDSTFAYAPNVNIWYHVAYCRSGTSLRVFVNGTQVGSTATNSISYGTNGTTAVIGGSTTADRLMTGYLDDFRITKGYARYTSSFTPPTSAFRTF